MAANPARLAERVQNLTFFPKANILTTEKLQEGDATIWSISIDDTKSVFKIS